MITEQAPRGGILEEVGGQRRPLVLNLGEIERFEDQHRSIFDVYDGFFGRGAKPSWAEVRDLIAIGLVGGGLSDGEASEIASGFGPADFQSLFRIAQAMVGIAFYPDADDQTGGEDEDPEKPVATTS